MSLLRTRFAKHSLLAVAYGLSPPKHSLKPRLDFAMMVRAALPDTICSRRSVIHLARHAGKTTLFATFPPRCAVTFTPCPDFGTLLDGTSFSPVCTPVRVGSFGGCLCPDHQMRQLTVRHRPLTKCVRAHHPPRTRMDLPSQNYPYQHSAGSWRRILSRKRCCAKSFSFPCLSCFHRVGAHSLSVVGQRLSVPIPGPHGNPNRRSGAGKIGVEPISINHMNLGL